MTTTHIGYCCARSTRFGRVLMLLLLLMALPTAFGSETDRQWVATWTASPQPTWPETFVLPAGVPEQLHQQTLRQVLRVSLGGERLRIVVSNAYGTRPLTIGAAHIAVAASGSAIVPETGRTITFGGRRDAVVPPGAPLISDPVDLEVDALTTLSVSIYLPNETPVSTFHWDARRTAYIEAGNRVDAPRLRPDQTITTRLFLTGVHVAREDAAGAVVLLGDSITDGNGAPMDANERWSDYLAQRLVPCDLAVVNAGISGARLLSDGMGENALARFERDVLSQPGADAVIVLLGINDISWPGTAFDPEGQPPEPAAIIAGYQQLIARARLHGVRVIGATLTPFENALEGTPMDDYYDSAKDRLRGRINEWIRTSGAFDAVIDFDRQLRDPDEPARLRPVFDSGDHLHPGRVGNKAMADYVEPDLLCGVSDRHH
ncbi:SGNH/GDSL hydrolase family protein [Aquisalimonas lutea]|uniref:SGNH/GDSL hydrolase family protein n=1 Tax=Aquisalimonas lutea TaxID=1327750 RepID=UPI0025B5ECA4|nr:SGNH/GDSL hydrolase family protein [Aquisalimonas lutea]MDN3516589.1 SGNH/GDSL hydrolase family protein [Aquisalimonas lutea]